MVIITGFDSPGSINTFLESDESLRRLALYRTPRYTRTTSAPANGPVFVTDPVNSHRRISTVRRVHRNVSNVEGGVGQAETEAEQRLDALRLEPAVTHLEPFGIADRVAVALVPAGVSLRLARVQGVVFRTGGYEVGTLPEGLTTPNSRSATTWPSSVPWFHASSTAGAFSIHGISTGLLSFITTTVVGLMPSSSCSIRF